MTPAETRLGFAVFLVLAGGCAANLLVFQGKHSGSLIETAALQGDESGWFARRAESAGQGHQASQQSSDNPGQSPASQKSAATGAADPGLNRADVVRGIQRELNTRGYGTGQPDGVAGLVTKAAIMAYEYDYGLPLTGEPTQDLLSRIILGAAGPAANPKALPPVKSAEAEGVVRAVQQYLAGLGYAAGKGDGKMTDETARAIREFELDQKMPETGRISAPLVARLVRLQGQGRTSAQR